MNIDMIILIIAIFLLIIIIELGILTYLEKHARHRYDNPKTNN